MKVWYNKVNDSRRSMVDVSAAEILIGRDPSNTIVLPSPLVSKKHAIVRQVNGKLQLENVGLNGCMVGEAEVLGGETVEFPAGERVRIWPFTLTFEAEQALRDQPRAEMEAHLRSIMAELELRIHRKLLERFDLYELENNQMGDPDSILLLENNIEDVCRELNLFGTTNDALLEEVTGLTLRDHLINQLILESGKAEASSLAAMTYNEFDIPATLVPERETELHNLLHFIRERLDLAGQADLSGRIHATETRFASKSSRSCGPTCTSNCGSI